MKSINGSTPQPFIAHEASHADTAARRKGPGRSMSSAKASTSLGASMVSWDLPVEDVESWWWKPDWTIQKISKHHLMGFTHQTYDKMMIQWDLTTQKGGLTGVSNKKHSTNRDFTSKQLVITS